MHCGRLWRALSTMQADKKRIPRGYFSGPTGEKMGWCFCQERRRRFLRVRQGRKLFSIPTCSSSLFSLHNNSTIYHCALIVEEVKRGRNDKLTDFCFVFLQLRYGKTLTCSAYTPKSCTYSKPSQRGQSERLYRTVHHIRKMTRKLVHSVFVERRSNHARQEHTTLHPIMRVVVEEEEEAIDLRGKNIALT